MVELAPQILSEYDRETDLYRGFTAKLGALIEDVLGARAIRVHSITSRAKSRQSLLRKLSKGSSRGYSALRDVTDLAGVRIITYFADDVDRVAVAVAEEFNIDSENSVDKRDILAPDRFGYLSLHYIVSLRSSRADLTEYSPYKHLRAEIQIRSILQHAWAEIEHDLGYKAAAAVPRPVRRQFSRVASLLEIADGEFVHIRDVLAAHERTVDQAIEAAPQDVEINKVSLTAFITRGGLVSEIDDAVAGVAGGLVEDLSATALERYVMGLKFLNVRSIAELQNALGERKESIIALACEWLKPRSGNVECGVSILYLQYVLLAERGDAERACEFFKVIAIGASDRQNAALANTLFDRWAKIAGSAPAGTPHFHEKHQDDEKRGR